MATAIGEDSLMCAVCIYYNISKAPSKATNPDTLELSGFCSHEMFTYFHLLKIRSQFGAEIFWQKVAHVKILWFLFPTKPLRHHQFMATLEGLFLEAWLNQNKGLK